jgi:hypothetical protein
MMMLVLVLVAVAMLMRVFMFMAMPMKMAVFVRVSVFVVMMRVPMVVVVMVMMIVRMIVTVAMIIRVHIKLHAINAGLLRAFRVGVIALDLERLKLALEFLEIRAQIQQGAHEHIAANAAENVEVKRVHSNSPAANALIWLAA